MNRKIFFPCTLALVSLVIVLIAFREWFFSFKILTDGDWSFFFNETATTLRIDYFSLWLSDNSFGRVLVDVGQAPTYFMYGVLSKYFNFTYAINERIIHFWPAIIVNILGSFLLLKKIFKKNYVPIIIGVLIYLLNTYFLDLFTGDVTLATGYAFSALLIYLLIVYVEKSSLIRGIWFSLVAFLASSYEPRTFYVTSIALLIVYIALLFKKSKAKTFSLYSEIKNIVWPALVFILLNVYWLLGLSQAHSLADNVLVDRGLFGDSYWNILYSFTLHHPWWSGEAVQVFQNQPIPAFFWVLPITAFLGLIVYRKRPLIVAFGVIGLIGIVLSKQVGEPFVHLYSWLYNHFPGFNAFREASKFYFLIVISYTVLIPSFINWVWENWKGNIWIYGKYILAIGIALIFLWNTKPFITGEIGTLFVSHSVPSEWAVFNKFILNQDEYFRTYWVPQQTRWATYSFLHSEVNGLDTVEGPWTDFDSLPSSAPSQDQVVSVFQHNYSAALFKAASIKYVVVPDQAPADDELFINSQTGANDLNIRNFYINTLDAVPFLKKIDIGTPDVAVYENESYDSPIFAFSNLYTLNSLTNLDEAYSFISSESADDFLFAPMNASATAAPTTEVDDVFSGIQPQSISVGANSISTSTQILSNDSSLYVNTGINDFFASLSGDEVQIYSESSGSLAVNNATLIAASSSERVFKTLYVDPNQTYYVSQGSSLSKLSPGSTVYLGNSTSTIAVYSASGNILSDASFETGLWQKKVNDCNNYDNNGKIGMSLDAATSTDGEYSLQLDATTHIACTHENVPITQPGKYVLSFDYGSPNANYAGYAVNQLPGTSHSVQEVPVVGSSWQSYTGEFDVFPTTSSISLALYSFSKDNTENIVNRYDNFFLSPLTLVAQVPPPTSEGFLQIPLKNINGNDVFSYKDENYSFANILPDGSLSSGLWQNKVSDCDNYDNNGKIGMRLVKDSTNNQNAVELDATRHIACTTDYIPVQGGNTYLLSFNYQSPNAGVASFRINFNNPEGNTIQQTINVNDHAWHTYSQTVTVPPDTSGIYFTIYAVATDGETQMVNRYDDFKLIEVPDLENRFYVVSYPNQQSETLPETVTFDTVSQTERVVHIKEARGPFFLAMSETYNPSWQLELNDGAVQGALNEWLPFAHPNKVPDEYHYELDDFLNAWYVDVPALCGTHSTACVKNPDGSYNIEMRIEFWPERWFNLGLLISGVTFVGCIVGIGYTIVRSRRKK